MTGFEVGSLHADALRSLLQEAMDREAQRITVTTRAYNTEPTDATTEKTGKLEGAKKFFAKVKVQFSHLSKALLRVA